MKLLSLRIKNFRSLRDVKLKEVGDLNVLVGKNSSGKSNLLEGLDLFFSEFALVGGTTAGLNEFFWHNKGTKEPIEFIVHIQFTDFECKDIFGEEIFGRMKDSLPETFNQFKIHRKITNLQGAWETESIEWLDIPLVKSNKQLGPAYVEKSLNSRMTKGTRTQPPPPRITVTPEILNSIHNNLTEKIEKKFKLIPQVRDVRTPTTYRMTLISPQLQNSLWSLDQSTKDPDEQMYSDIEKTFRCMHARTTFIEKRHQSILVREK